MNLDTVVAALPSPAGLAGLTLVAFGVPALLFEISLRRGRRLAIQSLRLVAQVESGFVRIRWFPIAIPAQEIQGFRVVRERVADNHRVTWTIAAADEAALDDWGVQAGEQYHFTVEMYLENARGEAGFVRGDVSIETPNIRVPREA